MARTITAANAVFLLTVPGLFSAPQRLQGFSADAAFVTEGVQFIEVVMGVDGVMSQGYTPNPYPMTVTIMPDSPSSDLFDRWAAAIQTSRDAIAASGQIEIPSIGQKFACLNGALTRYVPIPEARKVLQARAHTITWQSITAAPR